MEISIVELYINDAAMIDDKAMTVREEVFDSAKRNI